MNFLRWVCHGWQPGESLWRRKSMKHNEPLGSWVYVHRTTPAFLPSRNSLYYCQFDGRTGESVRVYVCLRRCFRKCVCVCVRLHVCTFPIIGRWNPKGGWEEKGKFSPLLIYIYKKTTLRIQPSPKKQLSVDANLLQAIHSVLQPTQSLNIYSVSTEKTFCHTNIFQSSYTHVCLQKTLQLTAMLQVRFWVEEILLRCFLGVQQSYKEPLGKW